MWLQVCRVQKWQRKSTPEEIKPSLRMTMCQYLSLRLRCNNSVPRQWMDVKCHPREASALGICNVLSFGRQIDKSVIAVNQLMGISACLKELLVSFEETPNDNPIKVSLVNTIRQSLGPEGAWRTCMRLFCCSLQIPKHL